MRPKRRWHGAWTTALTLVAAFSVAFVCSCGDDEDRDDGRAAEQECVVDTSYDPEIVPANFTATIDNPLLPLTPGTRLVYQGGDEEIVVEVTDETKQILGVTCVVIRDTVTEEGEVIEDTLDWYAQDLDGNVWYFGEDTKEYEDDVVVSTAGSWEAGVDGAKAGRIMLADAQVGNVYRQEYYACEAEDFAEVVALDESVSLPYGDLTGCLRTRDYSPLEPDVNEYKYYCPDVGVALEVDINTGLRTELTEITTF